VRRLVLLHIVYAHKMAQQLFLNQPIHLSFPPHIAAGDRRAHVHWRVNCYCCVRGGRRVASVRESKQHCYSRASRPAGARPSSRRGDIVEMPACCVTTSFTPSCCCVCLCVHSVCTAAVRLILSNHMGGCRRALSVRYR
jgi:hypothetical protein